MSSNRDYRNSKKPQQQKFVPKSQNPNPRHSLANSFRSATASTSGGDASTSRTEVAENGELRVNGTQTGGSFVIYLPQDEAVAAGLRPEDGGLDPVESQRVVDLLNRELSRLLRLRPKEFWREVATDESLHAFLESFLKFKSRWYDFPHRGAQGIVAGVIVGELELCRRVFMVLYRISSNQDPGAKAADTLSLQDHAALLQDKKLLDLPKLLDICSIYGRENEDLTRTLVMNAMTAQPYILDEFPLLMSHFFSIVQTMYQRCSSSLEVLLSSGGQDQGSHRLHLDYLEVMDFINDAVVSMDSFVNAHIHAAVLFSSPVETSHGNEELLTVLGRLHDSLLPSLQKGFHLIFSNVEVENHEKSSEMLSNAFMSLKMLSTRITKFCWSLIYLCYLSDEAFESGYSNPISMKMFPANVEDPTVRADILIQSIRDLSGGYAHVPLIKTWGTLIQNIEKNHKMLSRIELLTKAGWMSMDDEQFHFLAGIMSHPLATNTITNTLASLPVAANNAETDEHSAIMESKISQIKELFPDYGKGFLLACLEAYNHSPEDVIQRILEGTLHEDLQRLDISLEHIPPPKSTSSASKNDKGKGKLVDSGLSLPDVAPIVVKSGPAVSSSSSSSSVGRFVRKNMDNSPDLETLNARKEKELSKTAALALQLEYEDEYDDSFDDLGLSVGDSRLDEPETLGEPSDSDKWNSRKKPQFYVKDGKNYSYKVDGSVAVANYKEAKLVNLASKETIHGLGRGGNLPLGAVKKLTDTDKEQHEGGDSVGGRGFGRGSRGRGGGMLTNTEKEQHGDVSVGGRGFGRGSRGRGGGRQGSMSGAAKRGFVSSSERTAQGSNEENDDGGDVDEAGGRGGRGRGGGGRRGRGRNTFRKDRALSKHMAGLPGHFK